MFRRSWHTRDQTLLRLHKSGEHQRFHWALTNLLRYCCSREARVSLSSRRISDPRHTMKLSKNFTMLACYKALPTQTFFFYTFFAHFVNEFIWALTLYQDSTTKKEKKKNPKTEVWDNNNICMIKYRQPSVLNFFGNTKELTTRNCSRFLTKREFFILAALPCPQGSCSGFFRSS